jgi:gamma-glutamyltranspeptidase/glutathione hydrolase
MKKLLPALVVPVLSPAATAQKLGHKVTTASPGLKANGGERTANGWVGAADPRSIGTALGV